MLDTEFNNLQIHNWKIHIRKDFLKCNIKDLLLLSNKNTWEQSAFIKVPSSEYTNVFKCDVCIDGTIHSLYLKQYLTRSAWDFLKRLFRTSPAKRGLSASITLQNNGLDAPVVIGLFERRAGPFLIDNILLTKEIKNARSIVQCLADISRSLRKDTLLRKRNLIECFGETVGRMHTKGIFHGDLRLGNVLVQQKEEAWRFFFIDNERTKKFQRLPARLRLKNLVQINMFQENISDTDRMRFFRKYCAWNTQTKEAAKVLAKHVLKKTEQRLRNKKKPTKSMKKYLRTNEKYLRINMGGWLGVFDRSFCQEPEALNFVRNVAALMQQGDFLKKGDTSSVSRSMWNNKNIVTKQYNYRGFCHSLRHTIKGSRALRGWINGHRLLNLGIPTPKPLAYLEQRKGLLVWMSYLVTEFVDGQMLYDFERDTNVSKQQLSRIIGQIEELLERLAKHRISHGDLKHTNILITQNGPIFTDLDAMRVHRLKGIYSLKRAKDMARFLKKLDPSLLNKDYFAGYPVRRNR
jgi:tRNA A-37 threonylcarbamoyl transferase component Bud32